MIAPAPPRATISDEPDGLRITIPARRNWPAAIFLALWSVGWLVGEIAVPFQILDPQTAPSEKAFITLWLLFWTAAGAFVVYTWVWLATGREVLIFNGNSLTIARETAVFTRARLYQAQSIADLRTTSTANPWGIFDMRSTFAFWGLSGGHIAFDYGAKTCRIGAGVDEAEAKQIVKRILERYPALGEPTP